jgi:hypothetical protein
MPLAAALMLSLLGHAAPAPPLPPGSRALGHAGRARTHVGPWRIALAQDRFTGAITCAIAAPDVKLTRQTLIFRLGHGLSTLKADYRLDRGPSRPVSAVFAAVEDQGFFPERGWILDPEGGEVALPIAALQGARMITLRPAPGRRPRSFKIARLTEALILAKAAGCPAPGA